MAFDGIVLRAVRAELESCLTGARIEKIYQPLARDILIQLRNHGRSYKLLLSVNPTYPRVLLANRYQAQNPAVPPMFCMVLRKHLEGGIVRKIEQMENERILHFFIEAVDELGERVQRLLIIEIMGRHSNIVVIDPQTQTVFDSVVHITHATSRYREILPGRTYKAPPSQAKVNPFQLNRETYFKLRENQQQELTFHTFLSRHLLGVSQLLAKELASRIGEVAISEEWDLLAKFLHTWRHDQYSPTVRTNAETGQPLAFSVLQMTHLPGNDQSFLSISECLEWFYAEKVHYDMIQQKAGDLLRVLKTERERNSNKIEKLKAELLISKESEQYRLNGELVTGALHQIKRGDSYVDVMNFYEETLPIVRIELDPLLGPSENAQAYFKKYNKMKQSIPHIQEQIHLAKEEIRYLDEVMVQIEQASWAELDEIREELETGGYIKRKIRERKSKRAVKQKQPSKQTVHVERYQTPEGIEILVGKNNKQNDYLSTKLAQKTDTWLHTKDIPGSHVIIRAKEFSDQTLILAAQIAAYFSKGRESNQVPVDYTLIKHTWKPNGAKPGMILYENQRTLYVKPSLDGVEKSN